MKMLLRTSILMGIQLASAEIGGQVLPNDDKVKLLVKYVNSESKFSSTLISERNINPFDHTQDIVDRIASSAKPISVKGQISQVEIEGDVDAAIEALLADEEVAAVELDFAMYKFPNVVVSEELDVNHPAHNASRRLEDIVPYGIKLVQAPELWSAKRKPKPVKVCIVDTGYDITHDDLPNKGVTSTATNFADAFNDGDGHGTHIAGIIGALGNDEGVVGVNPTSKSLSFHISKALGDDGRGSASTIIEGVEGCLEAGAKIITLSLGGGMRSTIQEALFKKVYDQGVLVFAASGNSGTSKAEYPASYPSVISVAAVNEDEDYAGFSNFNDQVEFVGPGVNIKSTLPGNAYGLLSGTSMAAPHVAGAAALVWSFYPECSNNQIRNVLALTAKDVNPSSNGCNAKTGFGLIQAKAAYDMLASFGCEAGGLDTNPLSEGVEGGCHRLPAKPETIAEITGSPSTGPSASPSFKLFKEPIMKPSSSPTKPPLNNTEYDNSIQTPLMSPSIQPTQHQTDSPTKTSSPSISPTKAPNSTPSVNPSMNSRIASPSQTPSATSPSKSPSSTPSKSPSASPISSPTASPSALLSSSPSALPSKFPSSGPSKAPSSSPSASPTESPSLRPSKSPSVSPSFSPSTSPSTSPSDVPSISPSMSPSISPTEIYTAMFKHANCDTGEVWFSIDFTLNNDPSKLYWFLLEKCSRNIVFDCQDCYAKEDPFSVHSFGGCIPAEAGYTFYFNDYSGEAWRDGGYVIRLDGTKVFDTAGNVRSSEEIIIGSQKECPKPPTSVPTSSSPTSLAPTTACAVGENRLDVHFNLDFDASGVYWFLVDRCAGPLLHDCQACFTGMEPYTTQSFSTCLPPGYYSFIFNDYSGQQWSKGGYAISYDSVELFNSTGNVQQSQEVFIGSELDCPRSTKTSAPQTSAPSRSTSPTPLPTSITRTAAPINFSTGCPSDQIRFDVQFDFGTDPSEIYFYLIDRCAGTLVYSCQGCYAGSQPDSSKYFYRCVSKSRYSFVFNDYSGQQWSKGGYAINYNRTKVVDTRGNVESFNELMFGDESCGESSPQPTTSPTFMQNVYCEEFNLDLVTDNNPSEISWFLQQIHGDNPGIVSYGPVQGEQYESNSVYIGAASECLPPGEYQFSIHDTGYDGIRNPGYYKIYLNGVAIREGRDNNMGSLETTGFIIVNRDAGNGNLFT